MPAVTGVDPPVFVGRTGEVDAVRSVIARARMGTAGALLLAGDAGVGKSTIVQQVIGACDPDTVVLAGGGLPTASVTVPYLALRSAFRRLPDGLPMPACLRTDEGTERVLEGVDAWVEEVTQRSAVVLVMDDLHWTDQSTLDVLLYLLAGPRQRRFAVLATLRRGEVAEGDSLNTWLADVRRLPGFDVLDVGPLTRLETADQVSGLLGTPAHESLVDEVFTRTRGNCYLTRLLVTGLQPTTRHLPSRLPQDLEGALLARWHRLSPLGREITAILAIGGHRRSASEIAKVTGGLHDADDVGSVLRAAAGAGVLDLEESDGRFWFHHPLQAEVLVRHVPVDERRRWHEVFAAHFEAGLADPSDPGQLALVADHHFQAGHDEEAYHWSLRAAEGSSGGPERLRLLQRAVALRTRVPHDRLSRTDLLWMLKGAAQSTGAHRSELDAVEELLRNLDPAQAPPQCAELLVRRMHLRFSLGLGFITRADTDEAVRVGAAAPTSWQYAFALAEQAQAAHWEGDREMPDLADRAMHLATVCGHPLALSYAHTAKAIAVIDEDHRAAREEAALGRAFALQAGDFWAYAHAALWQGNAIDFWSAPETSDFMAACRHEATSAGAPHPYAAWLATNEAGGRLSAGRWEECAALLRICLGSEPGPLVEVAARLIAARFAVLQGRVDEAEAHVARVPEIFADPSGFTAFQYGPVRAEVLHAAGDLEGAVACVQATLDAPGVPPTMSEWLLPVAARALADLAQQAVDRGEDSTPVTRRLDELVRRFPVVLQDNGPSVFDGSASADSDVISPFYRRQLLALDAWYRAEVGRSHSRPDNAEEWEEAATLLVGADLPWEATYAGWRAGEAHLRGTKPDRSGAARWLRDTLETATRLRAEPVLVKLRATARAARIRLDTVDSLGVADSGDGMGLTRREREVLAHVVAGRTYAEIASDLVLSEKTVSAHISHMLRKTGAANRVELAALAARVGPSA